ncbi:MAG TPA: hypothetical protein PLX35_05200 [Cyclobacteriaceae bacterium]|nr:hypothetical protein [Cyclobacteriaceae bacterium]
MKTWTLRLLTTTALIAGLLLVIILNPILTYANKTSAGPVMIYSHQIPDKDFVTASNEALRILKTSPWYRDGLHLEICLNDGSTYPAIMRTLRGPAFAWGFYDKIVLQGNVNAEANTVELNGYRWNLTQLLAHEMTHCMQYDRLGLWKSKPIASIPDWKWEGYAEYVARQGMNRHDFATDLDRLEKTDTNAWAVALDDGTVAPRTYYEAWMLVRYCLDVRKITYEELLADPRTEEEWKRQINR